MHKERHHRWVARFGTPGHGMVQAAEVAPVPVVVPVQRNSKRGKRAHELCQHLQHIDRGE